MRITFLGTGTSHGVPNIDCMLQDYARCPVDACRKAEHDPRYRRTRASILVETDKASILVDTSQDFYQQVLRHKVRRIDAVLYTHGHADHIYGLPDIRSHCRHQGGAIDIYGSQETLDTLRSAFYYIFNPPEYIGGGIPDIRPNLFQATGEIHGLLVTPIPVQHGPMTGCQGYRFGNVAYIPDVKVIPPESLAQLGGLDLLIVNCLRQRPHSGHLTLADSLAYAQLLQPRRCLFTHMSHDIDYALEEQHLPEWARFAYDGLVVEA